MQGWGWVSGQGMSQWYIFHIFRTFSTLFILIFIPFLLCFMHLFLCFSCLIYGQSLYLNFILTILLFQTMLLSFPLFLQFFESHLGKRDKLLILGGPAITGDYLQGGRQVWVLTSPLISLPSKSSWASTSALSS